jgi:hypothetical protein
MPKKELVSQFIHFGEKKTKIKKLKKKEKKKHRPLLRFCSCKCQNMISVTHFEILSLGEKIVLSEHY